MLLLLLLDLLFLILLQFACSGIAALQNGGWYDPCRAGVPTITSTVTTRIWMDRNLGVDQGLDINTITSKQILDSTVVCTSGVVLVTVTIYKVE
jgi:hypothetical protein